MEKEVEGNLGKKREKRWKNGEEEGNRVGKNNFRTKQIICTKGIKNNQHPGIIYP